MISFSTAQRAIAFGAALSLGNRLWRWLTPIAQALLQVARILSRSSVMLVQEQPKLIGSIAKESGIPIKTIRYYDELGLLKTCGRTEGGYRLFNSDVFTRLSFIKRAQSLGLSLSEIKEFLDVHDQGDLPCDQIKVKLGDKLNAIEQQIQQLEILKQELKGLLSGWSAIPEHPEATICPIIERD